MRGLGSSECRHSRFPNDALFWFFWLFDRDLAFPCMHLESVCMSYRLGFKASNGVDQIAFMPDGSTGFFEDDEMGHNSFDVMDSDLDMDLDLDAEFIMEMNGLGRGGLFPGR